MTKKSYIHRKHRSRRPDKANQQTTVDKLKAEALGAANNSQGMGVQVHTVLISEMLAALITNPQFGFQDEVADILRALNDHKHACGSNSAKEPRICGCCNAEMDIDGFTAPEVAVSIRPFGRMQEAWDNKSLVVFGCGRCAKMGAKHVQDAALDMIVTDWNRVSVFRGGGY